MAQLDPETSKRETERRVEKETKREREREREGERERGERETAKLILILLNSKPSCVPPQI